MWLHQLHRQLQTLQETLHLQMVHLNKHSKSWSRSTQQHMVTSVPPASNTTGNCPPSRFIWTNKASGSWEMVNIIMQFISSIFWHWRQYLQMRVNWACHQAVHQFKASGSEGGIFRLPTWTNTAKAGQGVTHNSVWSIRSTSCFRHCKVNQLH